MKIIFKSLLFSLLIHVSYFLVTIGKAFIYTKNHVPDIDGSQVQLLQSEVSFGFVGSPVIFLFTFVGLGAIIMAILYLRSKGNAAKL